MTLSFSSCSSGMRSVVHGSNHCSLATSFKPQRQSLTSRRQSRASRHSRRAEGNEDQKIQQLKEQLQEKVPKGEELPGEGQAKTEDKSLAIVTGAISIVIGVLYLAGVTLLNGSRGNHLEAPPPEAFGWIAGHILQNLN